MDKVIISKGYNSLTGECSSELDTPPVPQIIDGVDVSGCNNIDEWKHCNICQVLIKTIPNRHQCLTEGDLRCEFYPDCYYKQLKRLQAEYDDLHLNYAGCKTANTGLQELNQKLQAENERLKANKGRCAFKCLDNTFCPEVDKKITELELSRDSYKVNYETAKKYREKAEKALQEIRDIAREWLNNDWSCFHCRSNMDDKLQDILDKINEVIGAE